MKLLKIFTYISFYALLGVWVYSLVTVYCQATIWSINTFPVVVDPNMRMLLLASSGVFASALFLTGLERLGMLPRIVDKIIGLQESRSIGVKSDSLGSTEEKKELD